MNRSPDLPRPRPELVVITGGDRLHDDLIDRVVAVRWLTDNREAA